MADTPQKLRLLLAASPTISIARRYFVTNGFDGALTLFGLIVGFYSSGDDIATEIVINACLGAAVALGVSGTTSAYLSEAAEQRKALRELERAMVTDLTDTVQEQASRLAPLFIAAVNGLAPVLMAAIIVAPLWLDAHGHALPLAALEAAIACAFGCVFLLGVYIGRISGTFWLWAGLRTALIALVTSAIILLLA